MVVTRPLPMRGLRVFLLPSSYGYKYYFFINFDSRFAAMFLAKTHKTALLQDKRTGGAGAGLVENSMGWGCFLCGVCCRHPFG